MKKTTFLILILIFIFCISGCNKDAITPTPTESKGPKDTIDPISIDWGYDKENDKYERWYLQGTDDVVYIYFLPSNAKPTICTYNLVKSGVVKESYTLSRTDDNHLTDPKNNVDLVFSDAFNCYDYKSDSYYKRGNIDELMTSFNNVTFEIKDNTKNNILFNADGTFKKTLDDVTTTGTWKITSKNNLRCTNETGTVDIYKILYNADGYVTSVQFESDTFYTTYIASVNEYK